MEWVKDDGKSLDTGKKFDPAAILLWDDHGQRLFKNGNRKSNGSFWDVFLPYDKQMDVKAQEVTGFQIKEHAITFLGVCPQCAAEKETA